jgi:hypothetical protein
MADHDTLFAIKKFLSASKIEWHTEHISSHQVDILPKAKLSRMEKLNCEMGKLAKDTM